MISFTVRLRFAPEDRAEIADVLEELTAASRQEPGCVHYLPHWVQGEPCTVLIYEQYQDQKAEEAHRQSPHFKKYAVAGLYQKMLERNREDLVAIVCGLAPQPLFFTLLHENLTNRVSVLARAGLPCDPAGNRKSKFVERCSFGHAI